MTLPSQLTVPAWEVPLGFPASDTKRTRSGPRTWRRNDQTEKHARTDWFESCMPAHRSYCGIRRRNMLIIVFVGLLSLFAILLGLGIGLTRKTSTANLPLPANSQTFTGDLTYYGTGLGACGVVVQDTDMIVSISHLVFDAAQIGSNPNTNPLCGLMIRVTRFYETAGVRRSVDVKVVDRCTGCSETDLDLSPKAFQQLADMDQGRVTGDWAWLRAASD